MNRWNLPEEPKFSVADLQRILKCGRNKVYELLGMGKNPVPAKIRSKKQGRNRVILYPWLVEYFENFEREEHE